MDKHYVAPVVIDHGNLVELTSATFIVGPEDGASKIQQDNHHSLPDFP